MGVVREVLSSIADLFFSEVCPFCNKIIYEKDALVCAGCLNKLEFISSPVCTCCGRPFHIEGIEDHFCGECLTDGRFYTKARAVLYYEAEVMEAIHRFKYSSAIYYARAFGWLMFNRGREFMDFTEYECLIPVPLHKKKLRQREFNQAQMLAQEISNYLCLQVELFVLERVIDAQSQVGLKKEERQRNVRNAFRVRNQEKIKNKAVLLIDDVLSTTSTVNEAAKALRKAGAKRVDVFALARGRDNQNPDNR